MISDHSTPPTWQAGSGRYPEPAQTPQIQRSFSAGRARPGDIVENTCGLGGSEWLRCDGYPYETPLALGTSGSAVHLQTDRLLPGMVVFSGLCGDAGCAPEEQLQQILEQIESTLASLGMAPTTLVRTWYYIDGILAWYERFNEVRTRWFGRHRMPDHRLPASTGIGAAIHGGHALRVDAIAIAPAAAWSCREAVSPLQGPASAYGSSFSRGMVLQSDRAKGLLISGTASINQEGETVHRGDTEAQMMHTLEVVAAMLREQGLTWRDVTRGIAYYLRGDGRDCLARCFARMGVPPLPLLHTAQTVCRDDLLFELELDAWKSL